MDRNGRSNRVDSRFGRFERIVPHIKFECVGAEEVIAFLFLESRPSRPPLRLGGVTRDSESRLAPQLDSCCGARLWAGPAAGSS